METLPNKTRNKKTVWIIAGFVLLGICLVCLVVGVAMTQIIQNANRTKNQTTEPIPTKVFNNDALEQMVDVPAGEFRMGITEPEIKDLLKAYPDWTRGLLIDALPNHTVYLDKYSIDKFEVTNEMFAQFISATNYRTDAEKDGWGEVFIEDV